MLAIRISVLCAFAVLIPHCVAAGSCGDHGITTCCTSDNCISQISPDGCFCDTSCREHGDCCDDIDDICETESCDEGSVRLADGSNEREGRVEVCIDNQWGTVCHHKWTNIDAQVVCRQLNYSNTGAAALRNALFMSGSGPIYMVNVGCHGNESNLLDCEYDNTTGGCNHGMDVSVICGAAVCDDGDVRLVGGDYPTEGRVEVCLNGVWGTICHDSWDRNDATVICRQLNYTAQRILSVGRGHFGQGKGAINMDDVRCTGNEEKLTDCAYNGNSDCTHNDDAGVFCGITLGCMDGSIRLANGVNQNEGRVEICVGGGWTTICDDGWDEYSARVVCRQLGYSIINVTAFNGTKFGAGNSDYRVLYTQFKCTGHENSLYDCMYSRTNSSVCPHTRDAGVRCSISGSGQCGDGSVRLAGGVDTNEGRVEVCYFGMWGTVCDHSWSTAHAEVICRQLGLPTLGATAYSGAYYGVGSGPINIDDAVCTGNEANISQCVFTSNDNCNHGNDAGVRCPCVNDEVRLVGGNVPSEGRVEICVGGLWGTVSDDGWDAYDSNVVCRQLGYRGNSSLPRLYASYGQGTGPIHMVSVSCSGTENRLIDCPYNPFTLTESHAEDASVACFDDALQGSSSCEPGQVRLSNGIGSLDGRVEVCTNGEWGTICSLLWDSRDSAVICSSLNYPRIGDAYFGGFYFRPGAGSGNIYMSAVGCTGNENSIFDCFYTGPLAGPCFNHLYDVAVMCYQSNNCSQGDVRLINAATPNTGQLEVCNEGVWSVISNDGYGLPDARVACAQLGFFPYVGIPRSVRYSRSIPYNQPVLFNPQCSGTEDRLTDCTFSPRGLLSNINLVAGVECYTKYDPASGPGSVPSCEIGSLRLVGGANEYEGRVEVCLNGAWGTICDDSWDTNDANVMCRQLGHSGYGAVALPQAHFGPGNGSILLDEFQCTGHESNWWECSSFNPIHNCAHNEDASIRCRPRECSEGNVRLTGGESSMEGRLEVCLNGTWGTVCDDFWSGYDAVVVCRQLNYSDTFALGYNTAFFGGNTNLPINMDNLHCVGNESSLTQCPFETHTADCTHQEDAGVKCYPKDLGIGTVCNNSDVRLVNGTTTSGRVEVCIDDTWGTVCDDRFEPVDALVVCRQLGFSDLGATPVPGAAFGVGTGPIFMDNTLCFGEEEKLLECLFDPHTSDCTHGRDVGVICSMKNECTTGDIRLVNGTRPTEGRVEVCLNGTWGTITTVGFDLLDAKVACRQAGYDGNYALTYGYSSLSYFGNGVGAVHIHQISCIGNESSLLDCPYEPLSINIVNPHIADAGVRCFNTTGATCTPGQIRLVNGTTPNEGRVEMCLDGEWGTLCGLLWIEIDALVACRQLGYNDYVALTLPAGSFGLGNATNSSDVPIYYTPLCTGSEETLLDCPQYQVGTCSHFSDAAFRCFNTELCTEGSLRLVNGTGQYEGRVEICQHGVWGTVCDDFISSTDARVVCRDLGYPELYTSSYVGGHFGMGYGPIHMDDVGCVGNEQRFIDCPHDQFTDDCNHNEDAGVACYNESQCALGDVRLVGGNYSYEGRVEFCRNGIWGSICDFSFDANDAAVVCRQLNLTTNYSVPYSSSYYTRSYGEIVATFFDCQGTESSLSQCFYSAQINCNHFSEAGVACYPEARCNVEGQVRLVDGRNDMEGRVEVCLGGVWGSITIFNLDSTEAGVICRSLGYPYIGAEVLYFGAGNGRIQMSSIECIGNETSITDCPYQSPSLFDSHVSDAGVRCHPLGNCSQGDVRLVGGATDGEGRVEVCLNNTWGTASRLGWTQDNSRVVCGQLGYTREIAFSDLQGSYGAGYGPVFMSNVECYGNESLLIHCSHVNAVSLGISHFLDVGVKCFNSTMSGQCTNGDVRLMDGVNRGSTRGRVEVCIEGVWRPVCDNGWSQSDANVVCRQLGHGEHDSRPYYASFFGPGTSPYVMEGVICDGEEERLVDCQFDYTPQCNALETAGVSCLTNNCTDGEVRLGDGMVLQGRVEICNGGVWGTVCDNFWDNLDAIVVCKQLNYSGAVAIAVTHSYFGIGTGPIFLHAVQCSGYENSLTDCSHNPVGLCNHGNDAGVKCFSSSPSDQCVLGDIRLAGGDANGTYGRVEVCLNGRWGTVCNTNWGPVETSSLCRQLGYQETGILSSVNVTLGTGDIYLNNVYCPNYVDTILKCGYNDNIVGCNHNTDVNVRCYPSDNCVEGDIRMVNKNTSEPYPNRGRVEVCYEGVWSVIHSLQWTQWMSNLTCRLSGHRLSQEPPYLVRDAYKFSNELRPTVSVYCRPLIDTSFSSCYTFLLPTTFDALQVAISCPCYDGEVRLRDGPVPHRGRVEICVNNTWGTISSTGWSLFDGRVVCRQLGYSSQILTVRYNGYYQAGTGPIHMRSLICDGNEKTLLDCFYSSDTSGYNHANDAGIDCYPLDNCNHGDLRLTNGTRYQGRVEFCLEGLWGTIDGVGWLHYEAAVVCRQLGFSQRYATTLTYPSIQDKPRAIGFVFCFGDEDFLVNCSYSTFSFGSPSVDAGVSCYADQVGNCSLGDVRLVDGMSEYEGRVEICVGGQWGTVCDDSWGQQEALIVCRQLGYSQAGFTFLTDSFFGNGTGPIFLNRTACNGNEADLLDCSHFPYSSSSCNHGQDSGVICLPGNNCTDGDVRLNGGSLPNEGRVELCIHGVWGTICHDSWDQTDAAVVCRQLGLPTTSVASLRESYFGLSNLPVLINNVICSGNETNLTQCASSTIIGSCSPNDQVGVACLNTSLCNHGDLRFLNGSAGDTRGTLEICVNGVWGTICGNHWTTEDAKVACKMLGLPTTYAKAYHDGFFGQGEGPIFLSRVHCHGNEQNLTSCWHSLEVDCIHSQDAGVSCLSSAECNVQGQMRLVNGTAPSNGRLEVCYNGLWGTVSQDRWDVYSVRIICSILGYNMSGLVRYNAYYGRGSGPVHLDNVFCYGGETNILQCSHSLNASEDTHNKDVGIECIIPINCTHGEVRLVDGDRPSEGRLEVCLQGSWGSVSHYGWNRQAAKVVCRQLGYSTKVALPYSNAYFGPGVGPVNIGSVNCNGDEATLLDCNYADFPLFYSHLFDIGIKCYNDTELNKNSTCSLGNLRLVGGPNSTSGRVELCLDNQWTTLCETFFLFNEIADVICKHLSFASRGARLVYADNANFGASNGSAIFRDLYCDGNEDNVLDCHYRTGTSSCSASNDIGVVCANPVCTQGDVRLIDGPSPSEGRVEVCDGQIWGTICDDTWDHLDSAVVCRQLGYSGDYALPHHFNYFPGATDPILIRSIHCNGNETQWSSCDYAITFIYICSHQEDAGVKCFNGSLEYNCTNGDVRLANGGDKFEGRVEVCVFGVWTTVCGDFWGIEEAAVVCNQLGYTDVAIPYPQAYFNQGTGPIYLSRMTCVGDESSLLHCQHSASSPSCTHTQDVGVRCALGNECNRTGDVRLADGLTRLEGRVEMCYNGVWSTIDRTNWDVVNSRVVCRQLGYNPFVSSVITPAVLGTGPILFTRFACTPSNTYLYNCTHSLVSSVVSHTRDVGVRCYDNVGGNCMQGQVRILNGIPQVCLSGLNWSMIIYNSFFNRQEAAVVCRQTGQAALGGTVRSVQVNLTTIDPQLSYVNCNGREDSILDCTYEITSTVTIIDSVIGLSCQPPVLCNDFDVRLVGGAVMNEGRVQACYGNSWGTLSSFLTRSTEANVICSQLGYANIGNSLVIDGRFGSANSSIPVAPISFLFCSGSEVNISQCTFFISFYSSSFDDEIAVSCLPNVVTSSPVIMPTSSSVISSYSTFISSSPPTLPPPSSSPPSQSISQSLSSTIQSTSVQSSVSPSSTIISSSPSPSSTSSPSSSSSSIAPSVAAVSSLSAVVKGDYTAETFNVTTFKNAIIASLNLYCTTSGQCRKRQTGWTRDSVVILSVKDVEGGVEVVFYVKMQNTDGIMDVDVLENAVQSGIEDGTFANAGFTDMAVHKTVPPTTGGLSSAASAGLAIGLIILIIIALSVVILVIVVWLKLKTRAYEVDKNILVDNVDSMSNRSSYIEIEGVTPRLEAELIAPPPMSEKEKEKFEEAKNEESSTSKL